MTVVKAVCFFFFFQAEDGIRDVAVTGVQSVLFRSFQIAACRNPLRRRPESANALGVLLGLHQKGTRLRKHILQKWPQEKTKSFKRLPIARKGTVRDAPADKKNRDFTLAGLAQKIWPDFCFQDEHESRPHGSKGDRKSTRLNSSHGYISYAVFCLKKKKKLNRNI